jgi:signal transduction histidine kinase
MAFNFNRSIYGIATIFCLALATIVALGIGASRNSQSLIESGIQVQKTSDLLRLLAKLSASMAVAESGRRGYIYLNSELERERYLEAVQSLRRDMSLLQIALHHDRDQQIRWNRLQRRLEQRLTLLKTSIVHHQTDPNDRAFQDQLTTESIALRGQIQMILDELEQREQALLQGYLRSASAQMHRQSQWEILGLLAVVGVTIGVFWALYRDVLRRQQIESLQLRLQQTQDVSELKVRLLSMLSHEFRTPLTVILAASQLVQSAPADSDRLSRNLLRIQSSARLMNHLLTDILMITRAELGQLEYRPEPIDLEGFCLNLIDDTQTLSPDHPIRFVGGCADRRWFDERLLYSMLSNLLSNAIRYSEPGSPIELRLLAGAILTRFEVEDRGIGISPTDQARVFEPFYRGDNAKACPGSGLGLAVVAQCVALHGGQVSLRSALGKGTLFVIEIPHSPQSVGPSAQVAPLPSSNLAPVDRAEEQPRSAESSV